MTDDQTVNDECGICLETLTAAVTLPCTHKFCADCLDGWKSKFGSSLLNKKEKSKWAMGRSAYHGYQISANIRPLINLIEHIKKNLARWAFQLSS